MDFMKAALNAFLIASHLMHLCVCNWFIDFALIALMKLTYGQNDGSNCGEFAKEEFNE